MIQKTISLLVAITFSLLGFSQDANKPPRIVLLGAEGVFQNAAGTWTQQFNDNFGIGINTGYKFSNNFIFSINGIYAFGGLVNKPAQVLEPLLTRNNQVLNSTGNFATLTVYTRATYGFVNLEKIVNLFRANENSGPIVEAGLGYLAHWIQIDNAGNDVAALQDDYDKGYDQFSHGPAFRASLGYLYLSQSRLVNFKLSFEVISGYTRNIRGYNYATGPVSNQANNNLLYGLKVNWFIPIYRGAKGQEYYYD